MNDNDNSHTYFQIFNSLDPKMRNDKPTATVYVSGDGPHEVPIINGQINLTGMINGPVSISYDLDDLGPDPIQHEPEVKAKYKPTKGKRDKFSRLAVIQQVQRNRNRK